MRRPGSREKVTHCIPLLYYRYGRRRLLAKDSTQSSTQCSFSTHSLLLSWQFNWLESLSPPGTASSCLTRASRRACRGPSSIVRATCTENHRFRVLYGWGRSSSTSLAPSSLKRRAHRSSGLPLRAPPSALHPCTSWLQLPRRPSSSR